jgi:hypothetical protein
VQKSPDDGQMDAIVNWLSGWSVAESLLQTECGQQIQRLLSALAVGGTSSAQATLSDFIFNLGSLVNSDGSPPLCLQKAIEATHRVETPNKRLFDTVYSFASELDTNQHNQIAASAMLALGSLGRENHDHRVDGSCQSDSLPARASILLQRRFQQFLDMDLPGESLHTQSMIKIAKIIDGATRNLRDRVMAATRSLSR